MTAASDPVRRGARMINQWRGVLVGVALAVAVSACVVGYLLPPFRSLPPAAQELKIIPWPPAKVPGYQRSCAPGPLPRCVFGQAWTDANSTPWGRDGCDERNSALRRDLRNVQTKPGTRGCVVLTGELSDPYTGQIVQFNRARRNDVEVDHVWPLAVLWSRGAANWPLSRRVDVANDPLNLVVTIAAANRAKSDKMPDRWQPATPAGRCLYVDRLVKVALQYDVPVTAAENAAISDLNENCP